MTKKLVGYHRPDIDEDSTEEEKKKARRDMTRSIAESIMAQSGGLFGDMDDEEWESLLDEAEASELEGEVNE